MQQAGKAFDTFSVPSEDGDLSTLFGCFPDVLNRLTRQST